MSQAGAMRHAGSGGLLHRASATTSAINNLRHTPQLSSAPSSSRPGHHHHPQRRQRFERQNTRTTRTKTRAGLEVRQDDLRVVDFYELLAWPLGPLITRSFHHHGAATHAATRRRTERQRQRRRRRRPSIERTWNPPPQEVSDDADVKTIKRAYHELAMYCHPDKSGDDGHDLCIMLNEAYAILKDPVARQLYDAELAVQREDDEDEFTGAAYSKWTTKKAKPGETRAVFVDEFTCIGCKQCVWAAPATFRMDDEHGRSRVYAQWLNDEDDIECAIASCPVDCIHWVQREQLPYLEHVTRVADKVSVGIKQSGQGRETISDPFDAAHAYEKARTRKIENRRAALEQERLTREWQAQREREEEAREEARGGGAGGGGGGGGERGPTFGQRKAYRASADKVKEKWSQGTGGKIEALKRRRWSDSGSTIPLERSLVPFGVDLDLYFRGVEEEKAAEVKETATAGR